MEMKRKRRTQTHRRGQRRRRTHRWPAAVVVYSARCRAPGHVAGRDGPNLSLASQRLLPHIHDPDRFLEWAATRSGAGARPIQATAEIEWASAPTCAGTGHMNRLSTMPLAKSGKILAATQMDFGSDGFRSSSLTTPATQSVSQRPDCSGIGKRDSATAPGRGTLSYVCRRRNSLSKSIVR
jgi:hypothetical protein